MAYYNDYTSRNSRLSDDGDPNPSWLKRVATNARDIVYNTQIEMVIGAVALTTVFSMFAYDAQKKNRGEIPIAFSEYESQVNPNALTRVYSKNNEISMKVFESNNKALAKDEEHVTFAKELQTRIDPAFKVHTLITELAKDMPQDVREALHSLDKLVQAERDLPPIMTALDKAWSEDHDDHYHTEYYTVTVSDGNGKSHTETRSRQVYDYTDHTYDYYPAYANEAANLLDAFVAKYPDLQIDERLKPAEKVHGDNEEAILQSMKERFKDKKPTAAEVLELANTWVSGSNLVKYLPAIVQHSRNLTAQAPAMRASLATAHSDSYRTYSSYDSGPKELQLTKSIRGDGAEITRGAHKITDPLADLATSIPGLVKDIQTYVDVVLNGKPGNADDLRDKIMDGARKNYETNFEGGFDVDPFKWWKIILMGMLGAGVGAGIGRGVDELLNRIEIKRENRRDERSQYRL